MNTVFVMTSLFALFGLASFACAGGDGSAGSAGSEAPKLPYSKSGYDLTPLPRDKVDAIVKHLDPIEVEVTQRAGTERAFTGRYWDEHRKGTYVSVVGGLPL